MASRPSGTRRKQPDVRVCFAGDRRALSAATVRRIVTAVLDGEGAGETLVTVTFLSSAKMRALNRNSFGEDRATDVIGFALPHQQILVGDVYVCPGTARRAARLLNVPVREELMRLVVHGTLHVLGYDHPSGDDRLDSCMWRLQERYVAASEGRGP